MTCVAANKSSLILVMLFVLLGQAVARAEEIQFSEEELPREAVMPRLDTPKAVLNRKLSYQKKWSADVAYGWLLDEPFYSNQYLAGSATYSWDESSGLGLKFLSFGTGLSDYSQQFAASVADSPQFARANGPSGGFIAFYERRMMYGKLSVSKRWVIPAFLHWGVEGGMLGYGGKQLPLAGGSLGNRFFLTKSLGMNLGLHAYLRQFVDPLSGNLKLSTTNDPDSFQTGTKLSTALDLSFTYLF